ncbi:MAG: xylulokinase [Sphaerochaetaceae bacterium]|nr:xylulokinase [Sphaerochaetaceae bacterium]
MAIVAGLDNGTQSTKVLVYDSEKKKVLALSQSPHQLISKPDGSREQEPAWWVEAASKCFSQIDASIRKRIQAIGVSGQQHGFVALDSNGIPLCPAKLWCDTSTSAQCDVINSALGGPEKVIELAGNEIKTGYTCAKVVKLRECHPELYSRLEHILLPHDYLNYFLTGEFTMEYGDASGTGFFDVRRRTWSDEILHAMDPDRDLRALLPRLIRAWEPSGTVCKAASERFGIPEGIPVSCGGGDNMMGAIGTGTVESGSLTMSLGTSGTIYGAFDSPVVDSKGRLAAFCSSTDSWLPLLCTMNCTVSSEMTRRILDKSLSQLNELASSSPIGASGVIMIPYFNGERTPNYPNGKGCILGLTMDNMTDANICRAAMESSIYGLKYGLDAFFELGFKASSIKLIGGGSNSALWRQMVSDVCNLPVQLPVNPEAAAFGAALQALLVFSGSKDIAAIVKEHVAMDESKDCTPDPDSVAKYKASYEAWLSAVSSMGPLFK